MRIITSGYPEIKGDTILEKRCYVREHLDHLRKLVMFEPRGHCNMYGAVIVQPHSEMADLGVIFMHNEGYSTMCCDGGIALGRYAVDSALLSTDVSRSSVGEVPVFIECPCGVVKALVDIAEGKSGRVRFVSVPAFAFGLDVEINTEKFGKVKVDIGFGGAFYAIVPGYRLGVDVRSSRLTDIVEAANAITEAGKVNLPFAFDARPRGTNIVLQLRAKNVQGRLYNRTICRPNLLYQFADNKESTADLSTKKS